MTDIAAPAIDSRSTTGCRFENNRRMWSGGARFGTIAFILLAACTKPNPAFCNDSSECNNGTVCENHSCVPATPVDAPPDAPDPRVNLTFQVARTISTGAPDPILDLAPIPGATVRVGPLDGPLAPAAYDETDGSVAFPRGLERSTWRLEYTIGMLITEVQWTPGESLGHLVVPMFGRIERTAPPINSGYQFRPIGPSAPTAATLFHWYTSGLWSEAVVPESTPAPYALDFTATRTFSGAPGAPDAAKGDRVYAFHFGASANCLPITDGVAAFPPPALVANSRSAASPEPVWNTSLKESVTYSYVSTSDAATRLASALGSRATSSAQGSVAGHIPHDGMPILANAYPNAATLPFIGLAQCPFGRASSDPFVSDAVMQTFPLAGFAAITNARSANGSTLESSIVAVGLSPNAVIDMSLPIATAPRLSDGVAVTDLAGASDRVVVPAGSGALELSRAGRDSIL